jgi:hypothetical protein
MNRLTLFFLQLLLGSARVRAFAGGTLVGFVARALFARTDAGLLPPLMGAVVVFAGAASVVCFSLDNAPRRDRLSLRRAAQQAVLWAGCGLLIALHLPTF